MNGPLLQSCHQRRPKTMDALKQQCEAAGLVCVDGHNSWYLRIEWSPLLRVLWYPWSEGAVAGDYFRTYGLGMASDGALDNLDSDYQSAHEEGGEVVAELMDFFFHPKEN